MTHAGYPLLFLLQSRAYRVALQIAQWVSHHPQHEVLGTLADSGLSMCLPSSLLISSSVFSVPVFIIK